MCFRSIALRGVIAISLTVLGCAVTGTTVSDHQWQFVKEREQQVARDAGRIGYIGNAGGTALSN
ncbi:MAG TPA: hypothetical protein VIT23_11765 [Terrimicrobiaceae bacterium]